MTTLCETPLARSDRDIGCRASGERCLLAPADGAADRACRKSRRADRQVVIALRGIDELRVDRDVAGAAAQVRARAKYRVAHVAVAARERVRPDDAVEESLGRRDRGRGQNGAVVDPRRSSDT